MFKIGDEVMYSSSGACKIIDITGKKFLDKEILYYVLQPLFETKSIIYCPVDSEVLKMRKMISAKDIYNILENATDETRDWIENEHERRENQSDIIKEGDQQELMKLINQLCQKRKEIITQGKKFRAGDEKAMAEAEKLLYQEFATVLDMKPEEIFKFIVAETEKTQSTTVEN